MVGEKRPGEEPAKGPAEKQVFQSTPLLRVELTSFR
jgi:hypothetical protein